MKTLYELTADFLNLDVLISEQPAELDAELALELDRLFADFATNEAEKLESYYRLIRRLEMEAAAARAEAEQYALAAKYRENTVERLKARVKDHIEFTGRTKATTASGKTFAVQRNSTAPLVTPPDLDLSKLEPRFVRVVASLDAVAVRKALADGETFDWATIGERGTHLRIR